VKDNDCEFVDQSEVEAGLIDVLMSLGGDGTVGLHEEIVGKEDEDGWAPQQSEM
jgi:diacylglycerol kinase family enzyme